MARGKHLEADDPSNIVEGKRKRTVSEKIKAAATTVHRVVSKASKSSRSSLKSAFTSDKSSVDLPRHSDTSSRPAKRVRKSTITGSDEEDEASVDQSVDDVIEVNSSEGVPSPRTMNSSATSPAPSGSVRSDRSAISSTHGDTPSGSIRSDRSISATDGDKANEEKETDEQELG